MPDLSSIELPHWIGLAAQILLGILIRFARGLVHGVFRAVMERDVGSADPRDLNTLETTKRINTLEGLTKGLIQAGVVCIASLMVLGLLGIDIGPALAGLGIAGVAIGFGAQSLVKDYFNGILILIE